MFNDEKSEYWNRLSRKAVDFPSSEILTEKTDVGTPQMSLILSWDIDKSISWPPPLILWTSQTTYERLKVYLIHFTNPVLAD